MKAEIEWHPEAEKPDDSTTVLVGFADGDVLQGYWDSEFSVWRSMEAVRFDGPTPVVCWADLPAVPAHLVIEEVPA